MAISHPPKQGYMTGASAMLGQEHVRYQKSASDKLTNAIYIDAKAGALPLTALIDCGNNLLRMSKDGQVVIIQQHSISMTLNIKLTRLGIGNFSEDISAEFHPTKQMI